MVDDARAIPHASGPGADIPAVSGTTFRGPGVSRRHLLQGAAWATPAIIIATSAPAAATSEAPVNKVVLHDAKAEVHDPYWIETQQGNGRVGRVLLVNFRVQNSGLGGESLTSSQIVFTVPEAALKGLPDHGFQYLDAGWTASVSVAGPALTVVLTHGGTIAPWGDSGGAIWIELKPGTDVMGKNFMMTATAQKGSGATASEPRNVVICAAAR